jgi:hypothetical protein
MDSSHLTQQQKQELSILMEELDRRGVDVSKALRFKKVRWPIDSRGYFTKRDGSQYEPSENQGGFIKSDSYFSAFIGPRGSSVHRPKR